MSSTTFCGERGTSSLPADPAYLVVEGRCQGRTQRLSALVGPAGLQSNQVNGSAILASGKSPPLGLGVYVQGAFHKTNTQADLLQDMEITLARLTRDAQGSTLAGCAGGRCRWQPQAKRR